MFDWRINVGDLIAIVVATGVLYSRLTGLETKIQPIWDWWNRMASREAGRTLREDDFRHHGR